MLTVLKTGQLIISLLLTVFVLVQSREGGLSSAVSSGAGYRSKRGLEKIIFVGTIVLGILFSFNSLWLIYLSE
ncbi:preprotein translocase subunit SecG [Patescibacteria group bacterium]|nr:preprotein translocase subunit SecG [Patescibacteria group bacterium]HOM78238.1 preprotein translocase subunit SecG [bacterium]